MKPYTNKDRWRHIKHFVDTHPYSEDNYRYLQDWLSHFETCDNCKWYEKDKYRCIIGSEECEWEPVEPMTTKPENLEECSHDRKTDDNDGKPNDTLSRTKMEERLDEAIQEAVFFLNENDDITLQGSLLDHLDVLKHIRGDKDE